ncbi:adenosine kinase [Propylenella binzhouense]|uniref:Adenosine kinase n=1 Tax=Propylenella binzhouense TaxID=2555902 RepID=A0A964T2Z3_9HYPH|nr:adenosine kinase [Propylenella binzhouense]MYZ47513.1 adenosine kinase [Propylenella binzhouense]
MSQTKFDVLTIGNAIVDVLAHAEEDFLVREGLVKGSMRLIDTEEAERLYGHMGPAHMISGGCAGNTAAGVASFGGRAAFIGKVADDDLGRFYRHDMNALGIHFPTADLVGGAPTARSMILITPDSERTMNTHLGACQELTPADIDRATVEAAEITYLEGYLWDPPKAKEAFREASRIAHAAGRRVAITLSDSFCVSRYREEFLQLMRGGAVDIVFANNHEALALYETSDFETAVGLLRKDVPLAVVTLGAAGSMVLAGEEEVRVPAAPVERIADLTGAGDLFASGFLYGLARNMAYAECGMLGSLAAAEIISHVGARPETSLSRVAAQGGLPA